MAANPDGDQLEVSWAHTIETRDGTLAADAKNINCFIEKDSQGTCIVKRPGSTYLTFGSGGTTPGPQGTAQGSVFISGTIWWIVNDVLYQNGNPAVSIVLPGVSPIGIPYYAISDFPFGTSYLSNGFQMFKIVGTTATLITGQPTPLVPGFVELDGVAYVMGTTGIIYGSAINDATTWPALDFVQADYWLGQGRGIVRHLNYIVALYNRGTVLYWDANAAPNGQGIALNPVLSSAFTMGCASGATIQELADVTYWLAFNKEYGPSVQSLQGLQMVSISTPYVEKILQTANLAATYATSLRIAGHSFYVLTLAIPGITLAYDVGTQQWAEWTSIVGGNVNVFVGKFSANNGFTQLSQDSSTGMVMQFSDSVYTDATGPLPVTCVTPNYDWGTLNWKRFGYMNQIANTVNTTVSVSYTDDDYQSFSTPRTIDLSTVRKQLRNCGSSRRRAWMLQHTDNTPLRVYDMKVSTTGLPR